MFDDALQCKSALSQYALVDKNLPYLTEEEWAAVHKICQFLKPFYDITTLFSGSEYATSDLYFHGYWEAYKLIFSFAIILDPRYKLKFVEYVFQKIYPISYTDKVWEVRDRMEELYWEYCRVFPDNSTSVTSSPDAERRDCNETMDERYVSNVYLNFWISI
ncbi:hypothetical protein DCAR_0934326 [Daucus carota subsp. sativus]|uniref:hAT-like transposase RNase-H fold domain-containing protein n=1 Tax=Daucus carota subsp. sativus TaxID=79200 RepID=A0AAF0XV20_DAUCS|nr:hypothetical protein DCAR_0934326 [Daucus carota subsp. sativus]